MKENCIYDDKTPATDYCSVCESPLCSICGYIVSEKRMCNHCYSLIAYRGEALKESKLEIKL